MTRKRHAHAPVDNRAAYAKIRQITASSKTACTAAHPEYQWSGQGIEAVFEVNQAL